LCAAKQFQAVAGPTAKTALEHFSLY